MVMDKISGFSNLSRELRNKFSGSEATQAKDETVAGSSDKGSEHRPLAGDKADISPRAHRLIALRNAMESGRKALDDLPEVRPDRVAEARARLNKGFYNSVEVRTRVAERLDDVAQKMEDI